MRIHQISVFLENRSGQLAQITRTLAEQHINLRALSIAETADYGLARMMPTRPALFCWSRATFCP